MSYTAKHLLTGEAFERPSIFTNPHKNNTIGKHNIDPAIEAYHRTLPHYAETQLHSLPSVACELGFSRVFLKDESTRFGLPSFKILGASWAIHQTICARLALPTSTSLQELKHALEQTSDVELVTCTDGNWGRACARMAMYLGVACRIYVPQFMSSYTLSLLKDEGAEVIVLTDGSYDDAIASVRRDCDRTGALMVMDTSWQGYEQIPRWVTDGYSTMLIETDRQVAAQTGGHEPGILFVSVGVGSWAHSVVEHYKSKSAENKIISVEPVASASFKESLHVGQLTSIETGRTILDGMNCGTPSIIAWPVLRDGVSIAVTVADRESHECVQFLQLQGVNAGPCGAATLAALEKLCEESELSEREEKIVVLFSTEGIRAYEIPV